MTTQSLILILGTLVLAGASLGAGAVLPRRDRAAFFFALLMLMSGIYAGFAIIGLDPVETANKAKWSTLLVEGVVALGFLFAGCAALPSARVWILGALIMLHGVIDLAHLLMGAGYAPEWPEWYFFACAIYDAMVGFGAIWLLSPKAAGASAADPSLSK